VDLVHKGKLQIASSEKIFADVCVLPLLKPLLFFFAFVMKNYGKSAF